MSQGPNGYGRGGYDHSRFGDAHYEAGHPTGSTGHTNYFVRQVLWAATGVFGLAAWAVGLATVVPLGLAIPLSVLAGAVAVIGLLPGQQARGWLVVPVAASALADVVTTTVTTGGTTWVLIGVDVLVALQVVLAISALLLEPRESAVTRSTPETDYAAYAQYVQAYQEYAEQYGSSWADQYPAAGAADAAGHAQATVASTARGDDDPWADIQTKYAQHAAPVVSEDRRRQADDGTHRDAGLPGVNRADRPGEGSGKAARGAAPTSPGAY